MANGRDELVNLLCSYQEFLDVAGLLGVQATIAGDAVRQDPALAQLAPLAARLQTQILAAVQRVADEFPPDLLAAMERAEAGPEAHNTVREDQDAI
jgi:hypothetical protein